MSERVKQAVYCDKCKKPVYVKPGDVVCHLVQIETVVKELNDTEHNNSIIKYELSLCPECYIMFNQWLLT